MSTFAAGIDRLIEAVGTGPLRMRVEIDQIYAHYQHERADLRHPRGGKPFYLRDPLFANHEDYLRHLASLTITADGSDIERGAREVVEQLVFDSEAETPHDTGRLSLSGHPTVESDGVVIYDRPPHAPRATEEELKAERRRRGPNAR